MTKAKPLPPIDLVSDLLSYDPETGDLRWKVTKSNRAKAGQSAGFYRDGGYGMVAINKQTYYVHRIAWLLSTGCDPGDCDVDHKDRDKHNNRLDNLRLATRSQNQQNLTTAKGYSLNKRSGKYQACIWNKGERFHLGVFDTPEEAHTAYLEAKANMHEFCPVLVS